MVQRETECEWGVCPRCLRTDGYVNVGRNHWLFCRRSDEVVCGHQSVLGLASRNAGRLGGERVAASRPR